MFRLFLAGFVVSAVLVEGEFSADADNFTEVAENHATQIDPIITGHTVSAEHKRKWIAQNKKYKECGLCGELQAYPGD